MRILLAFLIFKLISFSVMAQESNRYYISDEELLQRFRDFYNVYIVLDLVDYPDGKETKILLTNQELHFYKFKHTNIEEDFVDSIGVIKNNNWRLKDDNDSLKRFKIIKDHYKFISSMKSSEIYQLYFTEIGNWNTEVDEEIIRAAATVLIERGNFVYFTGASRYTIFHVRE